MNDKYLKLTIYNCTKEHIDFTYMKEPNQTDNSVDEALFGKNDIIPLGISEFPAKDLIKHIPTIKQETRLDKIKEWLKCRFTSNVLTKLASV